MDWQSFQLASQVPQVYNSQNHGTQYNFGGSYPTSLQSNAGSYFPGGNYLPNAHSHNRIYPQQVTAYDQNNGGYPNTGDSYFQHQIQTFQQPFPVELALPGGTGLSAFPPQVMAPVQQLHSFVQPQQHSQTHNGLSVQWGATPRRALPPPQRSQNRDNSRQFASQNTSEQPATRTPASIEGNHGYVPVNPRFGDLYHPKQRDNMGNPTTWEHIVTKEEYTHDELQVIHEGIEVWAYLHTRPEIRRLRADH
ncbi:hypothetical protein BGX38DRAFT_484947 [Terfezia claveryi]|nr:hypothetical protein BGX38DRAFT_484947 [Terfezia claveryi]